MLLADRKQRRKVVIAGNYVRSIQYSLSHEREAQKERLPKTQISSPAQEAMNLKHSWQKLKALMAANFGPNDLVVTLTYSNERLPRLRSEAEKRLKLFIRRLRAARRESGIETPYLYVTEMGHSSGRLHHHMIVTAVGDDFNLIRELWARNGTDVDIQYIRTKGYDGWSRYLTKEPRDNGRRYVGERMWRGSIGLKKPHVYSGWVSPRNHMGDLPPGSEIIDSQSRNNGYGEFSFIEALLPEGVTEEDLALISDLR